MAYDEHAPIQPNRDIASNHSMPTTPDTSKVEALLAAAKAASQLIPFAGGSIAEAVGYFGQRYIEKQQNAFIEAVLCGLEELRIDVDNLNDSFFATFLYSLEVARRSHEQEKREALKNAVLHTATLESPSEDVRHIFVSIVADITPLHIVLLDFILNPQKYGVGSDLYRSLQYLRVDKDLIWQVLKNAIPTADRPDVVLLCFGDLVNRHLLVYPGFGRNQDFLVLPRPTSLASEFMRFISAPQQ